MSDKQRFHIADDVFDRFPTYLVALVEVRCTDQESALKPIARLRDEAAARHCACYPNTDLKTLEPISVWRNALSQAGWSASQYPVSVEALAKRVARSGELPAILPLVDLANLTALTYLVPIGTHDVASLYGGLLEVRTGTSVDMFVPPGGAAEPEIPASGEIVYVSGNDVRTRRWVWRQSKSALISLDSSYVLLPIDGFTDATYRRVEAASEYLARTATELFDATVSVHWLDWDSRQTHLQLG